MSRTRLCRPPAAGLRAALEMLAQEESAFRLCRRALGPALPPSAAGGVPPVSPPLPREQAGEPIGLRHDGGNHE